VADLRAEARRIAAKYRLDPGIFERQIEAESGFNPNARSPAGAQGIAQFMPATARAYGVNTADPISSLDGAARYLRDNLKRTGGSYAEALSIYNSGRPDGYKSIPETRNYVQRILGGTSPKSAAPTANSAPSAAVAQPAAPVDRSESLQQYLATRGRPGALLGLAQSLATDKATAPAASAGAAGAATTHTATFSTPPSASGVAKFDGKLVAAWIKPALEYARQHGWKGTVNSGYRSFADQTRIYNSGVRPAARPGTSNHEGTQYPRGAVDVSDAPTLARILQKSPYGRRLQWAGAKDPVHFSHPHNSSY